MKKLTINNPEEFVREMELQPYSKKSRAIEILRGCIKTKFGGAWGVEQVAWARWIVGEIAGQIIRDQMKNN